MNRARTLTVAMFLAAGGCEGNSGTEAETSAALSSGHGGEALFEHQTFDGNGRVCATCHAENSAFTITPASVQQRFAANPHDPLFRSLDSDDGVGNSYSRLQTDATILVNIPLPANVSIKGSSARTARFARAVPTIANIGLDPVLMSDGRAPNLEAQAASAVNSHFEPGHQPTASQLKLIADYERTEFSSPALAKFAKGGAAPELPAGNTESEKRGRNFFLETPTGLCNHCHNGPMLNEMSPFNPPGLPPGSRFFTAFVSELNEAGNDVQTFVFTDPSGATTEVTTPDPGLGLITGVAQTANLFKIPTLWGISKTAPYFHDNSGRTLEDVVAHYKVMFQIVSGGAVVLSDQDQADIVAYLKLL